MIGEKYPLSEKDAGEYALINVAGMDFRLRCFNAEGLGNISLMCSEVPVMMKMDTVVVNPFYMDMPLLSYDRIIAAGYDTLFLELYDTKLGYVPDTKGLARVNGEFRDLSDRPFGSAWYDDIMYKESISKKVPSELSGRLDMLTDEYLCEYLSMCGQAPECNCSDKKKAASVYTEGLLEHGGVSTDNFVKAKGKEFTSDMFRKVLFGTGEPE